MVNTEPYLGSESFASMLKMYPGVYAFLGVRNEELGICADNHNPNFDIDEKGLYLGTALSVGYALEFLESDIQIDFKPWEGTPDELYQDMEYAVD